MSLFEVEIVGSRNAGHQLSQLDEVPAVEGELGDLFSGDRAGDLAADRFDHDKRRLDGDLIGDLSDLHLYVGFPNGRNAELHVVHNDVVESIDIYRRPSGHRDSHILDTLHVRANYNRTRIGQRTTRSAGARQGHR